jgi:hypothetical protein
MIDKAQLFLNATALDIAIVITTPYAPHTEILEGVAKHLARSFRYQPLTPKGLAYPIAKLVFVIKLGKVIAVKADAPYSLSVFFETNGKCI